MGRGWAKYRDLSGASRSMKDTDKSRYFAITRIVGFTLFVEVLFEQDVQNIFKERKINCSLTYVIHSTQKWKKKKHVEKRTTH